MTYFCGRTEGVRTYDDSDLQQARMVFYPLGGVRGSLGLR